MTTANNNADGTWTMHPVAHIETDFPQKFGIPRQSGLVPELRARIVFEPEYRDPNAFKGIEGFTHLWLIWQFSKAARKTWSPTVQPPRLGGNTHMGVFATRSPFRPNPIGLSCVKFEGLEIDPKLGPVLNVSGADLMNGTPIYDIKPYVRYADCHPEAVSGFANEVHDSGLTVEFPEQLLKLLPEDKREAAIGVLQQDPRPSYQDDPERRYGVAFAGFDLRFHVKDNVLTVCQVKLPDGREIDA